MVEDQGPGVEPEPPLSGEERRAERKRLRAVRRERRGQAYGRSKDRKKDKKGKGDKKRGGRR